MTPIQIFAIIFCGVTLIWLLMQVGMVLQNYYFFFFYSLIKSIYVLEDYFEIKVNLIGIAEDDLYIG